MSEVDAAPPLARDPVCGMSVDPAKTAHHAEHGGCAYHFCSAGCRKKFEADPQKYLAPPPTAPPPARPGAVHTCPMHPEVRQIGPGACPICGMALEPAAVTLEDAPNRELADMSRRFWFGLVFAAPLVVLDMGGHVAGHPMLLEDPLGRWLQALLASPVVLWAGWPFLRRGWASVVRRHLNMFTLIGLGVAVAYAASVAALVAPGIFRAEARGDAGPPLYFEAAAVIVALALLGQVLELRARERTGGAVRALLALAPKTARRVTMAGHDEDVALAAIEVGDTLRVRPGDAVVGGAINRTGGFTMRAEKVGADTLVAR
ncbi:MAG TPA: YHS domain-containing protein, partial [Caulobacteraceae bacterium]